MTDIRHPENMTSVSNVCRSGQHDTCLAGPPGGRCFCEHHEVEYAPEALAAQKEAQASRLAYDEEQERRRHRG